jgi:hypothetical protein
VGVLTEEKKEIESIREYLYMLFTLSLDYDGIMCCLWDTSNKTIGDMNFYDRTNDIWYDEKLKNNFIQISKGKYIKPRDYYIKTTFKTVENALSYESFLLTFGNKKVSKIIIKAIITGALFVDFDLSIFTNDKYGYESTIKYGKENAKKQYDGTYIIEIDVSKRECFDYVQATVIWGKEYITLINLTVEFKESFQFIDYKSFKKAISKFIY